MCHPSLRKLPSWHNGTIKWSRTIQHEEPVVCMVAFNISTSIFSTKQLSLRIKIWINPSLWSLCVEATTSDATDPRSPWSTQRGKIPTLEGPFHLLLSQLLLWSCCLPGPRIPQCTACTRQTQAQNNLWKKGKELHSEPADDCVTMFSPKGRSALKAT